MPPPPGDYDGPGTGPYRIELRDGTGAVLFERSFSIDDPFDFDDRTPGHFREWIPYPTTTASIVILYDTLTLSQVDVTDHAPTVQLVAPTTGAVWNGDVPFVVAWQAADADGDALTAQVSYSGDGGGSWRALGVDLTAQQLSVDGLGLAGSDQALIRVAVSDGVNTTVAISSGTFQVSLKPPLPVIVGPADGSFSTTGLPLVLTGFASDPEDGPLAEAALVWSSDRDGAIGIGDTLTTGEISCGRHTITLTATDSDTMTASTSADVLVMGPCVAFVPASAHAAGAAGTNWVSDLVLHNPGAAPAEALLYFAKRAATALLAPPETVAVPAGASLRLADVVEDTFAQSAASGAILIGADAPLVLSSRTYNDSASGTFGQYIPGDPSSAAVADGERALLLQLTRNTGYRTNIGVTNVTQHQIGVTVDLFAADGATLGQRTATVPALGHVQLDDVLAGLIFGDIADAYAVVRGSDAAAAFFAYASVIDNVSGDPIYSAPATLSALPLMVPAAAHVTGAAGTNWRTDLEVVNPLTTQASFRIELLRRDQENSSPQAATYQLEAGRAMRYADVVSSVFSFEGAAALRIVPLQGEVAVSSRTYNQLADRTFGQYIPGVPESDALAAGQQGRIVQLAHSPDTASGYRTNIGLTNAGSATTTVAIALHDGGGTLLGTRNIDLRAYEHRQLNDVFREFTSQTLADAYAVVSSSTEGARYFAYGSVVDNRSGDPIYVPARPVGSAPEATDAAFARDTAAFVTQSSPRSSRTVAAAIPPGLVRFRAAFALLVLAAAGLAASRRTRQLNSRGRGKGVHRSVAS